MKVNGDFPGLSVGWASWVDAEAEVSSGLPITFFTKMLEGAPDLANIWHILTWDERFRFFGKREGGPLHSRQLRGILFN